jgi:hypothetical protein
VAVLFLGSIASATHDISCDGLYIASLSKKAQAQYAGWTGTFFNAGRLLAQGGLLTLAGYLEQKYGVTSAWTVIFGIIGLTMCALGGYNYWALPLSPNPRLAEHSAGAVARTLGEVIIDYFRKPGIWISILFTVPAVIVGIAMVKTAHDMYPDHFQWRQNDYEYEFGRNPFDIVCGTDKIRKAIEANTSMLEIEELCLAGLKEFSDLRSAYLIY